MSLAHREPPVRRPLELEILEDRIAPAGGVTTALSHGTLTITGDALANDIVIDQAGLAPGEFRIATGTDATTVNGQAEDIIGGVTGGIVLKLGDGDDSVQFDAVDVAKNIISYGQAGANEFQLTGGSIIHGSIIARNANAVSIVGATVTGDVKILNSTGSSSLTVDGLDARSLSVVNGSGDDTATFTDLTLSGRLSIHSGNGAATVNLANSSVSAVAFSSGSGTAGFTADGLTCTSGGQALRVSDGPRTADVSIQSSTIHGSVYIAGDEVDLDDTTVMKGIAAVGGISRFHAEGCDLGIDAANGRYYGVRVSGANGHLTELIDVSIGRGFRLKSVPYGGLFTFGWPVFVSMDGVHIGGNLSISTWTGGATDCWITATYVAGTTAISSLFNGADSIEIDDSTFSGAVAISTGWGNDSVAIEANGDPAGPVSTFAHSVRIIAGDGDDTVVLGIAGQIGNHGDYLAAVLLDGGNGFDTLTLQSGANTFAITPVPKAFEVINT